MCFSRVDLEHIGAVDLLHRKKSGGHAATGRHELPAAQAKLLAVLISEFKNPPLYTFLYLALLGRQILTVRNDLSRNGCRSGSFFSSGDKAHFAFAKPTAHLGPPCFDGC